MLYKLADGRVKDENYGLLLARLAQLPESVVNRATVVSETLTKQRELAKMKSQMYNMVRRRRAVLRLVESLKEARDGRMDEAVLKSWLARLQREFVARMEVLGIEEGEEEGEQAGEADAMLIDDEDEDGDEQMVDEHTTTKANTEENGSTAGEQEWEELFDGIEGDEDALLNGGDA